MCFFVDINLIKVRLFKNGMIIPVEIENTPHYELLKGNEEEYVKYMNIVKQPEHSLEIYLNLIKNFNFNNYGCIECKKNNNFYAVYDGFHRVSILKYNKIKKVKIILI